MQFLNLNDYKTAACQHLPPEIWDYFEGGSEDEVTLHANRTAYQQLRLRPHVLVDVSSCSTHTTILGTAVRAPILIAPIGCQCLAHAEGECAMARGTAAAGSLMAVSTMSTRSLEDVAAAAEPLWFQLYVYRDRSISEELTGRAGAVGYRALVVTVDTPRLGRRERDLRNAFSLPSDMHFANFARMQSSMALQRVAGVSGLAAHAAATFDSSFTWNDISWLRSITSMPIVLKGVLRAEDARRAVEHGVEGIIVSNHGGRQLDGVIPTIEALPEVINAVEGRCEVYLDGGVRRGTDVLKALALGARAVFIGRPALWGLAIGGEAGVHRVLDLLRSELEDALALAGCPTLASIDRGLVS